MRVRTATSQLFDLGLSGSETQEHFTDDKYRALAGGSTAGMRLAMLVEQHWSSWLDYVEKAPWLRNWTRSSRYTTDSCASTPAGTQLPGTLYKRHAIATAIYVETIWGYGMVGWLRGSSSAMLDGGKYNAPMRSILNLQNVKCPNQARTYMWDDKIYRGCGILVPCEIGDLDRWLEPLWQEALETLRVAGTLATGPRLDAS